MFKSIVAATALLVSTWAPSALCDEQKCETAECTQSLPREDTLRILNHVSEQTGKKFILDPRVPARIVVGPIDAKSITYPILLTILKLNGFAAIANHGIVAIVPDAYVRQEQIPTITGESSTIADDEVVTQVYRVTYLSAANLVPILRPMLPQAGHLAAIADQNALIIVDHYGNVRRLIAIIRELDKPWTKPEQPPSAK